MAKQLTAPGLTTPRKKACRSKLNAQEAAQLIECMRNGMPAPKLHQRGAKPLNDLPLFEAHATKDQTNLF